MRDVSTKVIGLIIAFIIMVFAPLAVFSLVQDLSTKRETLNEVVKFVDKTTDCGEIDAISLGDFYLACSAHGNINDVTITRFVKVVNPDGNGGTYTSYTPTLIDEDMATGKSIDLNKGDILQVHVKCIDYTGAQKITSVIFKYMSKPYEVTLAGRVRN